MKTAILQTLLTSFFALSGECDRGFRCASLAHSGGKLRRVGAKQFQEIARFRRWFSCRQ